MTEKKRPILYFYLDGDLHKKLHINRGKDEITTWCYPKGRRATMPYSDVRKRMDPAFTTHEAARLLNRGHRTIFNAILNGDVAEPQHVYTLTEKKYKLKYMLSEANVLELHAYLSTIHKGRPRKDGLITPMRLPNVRELRAQMRNREVLYVQVGDEFRPTWDAPDI